jgi:hypothetical protein
LTSEPTAGESRCHARGSSNCDRSTRSPGGFLGGE